MLLTAVAGLLAATACTSTPPAAESGTVTPGEPAPTSPPSTADVRRAAGFRAAHTMTPLPSGDLLIAGGCDVDGCTTATDTVFLVRGEEVLEVAPMHGARDAHTAVELRDGRVLVIGGFAGEGEPPLTTSELFDPATGDWTATGELTTGRGGHAAALLGDGRVLVAGGWVGSRTYTGTTEIYDPSSGDFVPGPDLPEPADSLAAVSLADGCVLLTGGQVAPGKATPAASTVCSDGVLADVGSMREPRFKHGLATLSDGRVVIVGGTADDRQLLASTEVFDPVTGAFSAGPHLRGGRYKLSGSVLALDDDRVVVAGGGPGVEVVDLVRRRSEVVTPFGERRRSFSTLGVSHDRLVLVGGYDERIALTGTLEMIGLDGI